jgi:hypothetical protein
LGEERRKKILKKKLKEKRTKRNKVKIRKEEEILKQRFRETRKEMCR